MMASQFGIPWIPMSVHCLELQTGGQQKICAYSIDDGRNQFHSQFVDESPPKNSIICSSQFLQTTLVLWSLICKGFELQISRCQTQENFGEL